MNSKVIITSFIAASVLVVPSCKSVYKCGDPVPAKKSFFWGNRLRTVIDERDMLCNRISEDEADIDSLIRDTVRLHNSLVAKEKSLDSLTALYNELNDSKLSDAEKYNKALKQKSDEIAAKEKQLAEREQALKKLQDALNKKEDAANALNESIKKALRGFNTDELQVTEKDGKVYVSLSNKLLFASGSVTVNQKGHDALKALADVMNKNTNIDIEVEGHTDNVPFRVKPGNETGGIVVKDNWDLSVMRATSIVKILTDEYKVDPKQVHASGRGEFFPKADNASEEGRSANRRTEIILSPKIDEVLNLIKK
ncbi:MAG: OmpA family protein [Paludibacteraceae bacterium]|nr:OmpA family protein [Paludibacteraceae bacterium]